MTIQLTKYIPPDSDPISEKFICYIMNGGKKTIARKIFADMLKEMEKRGHKNPKETFKHAMESIKPSMEVRPKRVGGAVYQVPFEVNPKRQQMLSFQWVLKSAKARKGIPMYKKLAQEILEANEGTGNAIKKRDDVHKMAQANKAFAHLARFT